MSFENLFSKRATAIKSSVIREILKFTARPEVISFAGGLPSDASFPVPQLKAAFEKVLNDAPQAALQYSTTDGYAPLREWVASEKSKLGATITPDQVIIVSGSQQALDLIGKVFINEGDKVLVETPTYLGALQAFELFFPEFVSVASDEEGLDAAQLTAEQAQGAKFLYALPNFQNPTGRLMTEERRQALVAKAREYNLLVVEDDPLLLGLVRQMLGKLGYAVHEADTPAAALALAAHHDGDLDVVLTDVVLPEMDGRDLADRIRALRPSIRVVFMSGYAPGMLTDRGVLAQGAAFLQKPFPLHQLARRLRQVLDPADTPS